MGQKKGYPPDVYKRLELVEKQFQSNTTEQKKQRSVERRQRFFDTFRQHKVSILRLTTYTLMALLVIAIILVVVLN